MKKSNMNMTAKMLSLTIPRGAKAIDIVETERFPLGAILIRFQNGNYALHSAGVTTHCDQREAREYVEAMNN